MRAHLRAHGLPALALLLVVLVALWPLPRLLGSPTALGHPVGDLADHYWGTWWWGHEILSGRWPASTDLVRYPGPVTLWYVDPVGAALGLLLRPLGSPLAWNGMLLLQVWLGALAAYAVAQRYSGSRVAALLAGVAVGSSPYVVALAHSGLSEYIGLTFPILFVGALISAMDLDPQGRAPGRRAALVAGLLLAGCAAQAFYYAAFGALLTAVAVIGPGWRRRLFVATKIAVVFAVVASPLFFVAWRTLSSPEAAVTTENAPGWSYRALPATDLLTFLHPGSYYFPDMRGDNPGILHVNYLGWVLVALAVAALWRSRAATEGRGARALLPMTVGFAILTLGPRLCVDGRLPSWGGASIPLPLALLYIPGSPFRFVHHPYRMVAFLIPLLAVLAALTARRLPRPAVAALTVGILAENLLVSPAPWPLVSTDVSAPGIYASLDAGPVLDWPPDATSWNRMYAIWQTSHGRPIAYGVNTFLSDDLLHDPLIQHLLQGLATPERRAKNRDIPSTQRLFVAPDTTTTSIGTLGFRVVVLHGAALSEGERSRARTALNATFGPPVVERDDDAAWSVPAPP